MFAPLGYKYATGSPDHRKMLESRSVSMYATKLPSLSTRSTCSANTTESAIAHRAKKTEICIRRLDILEPPLAYQECSAYSLILDRLDDNTMCLRSSLMWLVMPS